MSLHLNDKLAEELRFLDSRKLCKESLLSAIIETLMSIETTQNEVMIPSLMSDDRINKENDSEELSVSELLSAAKVIKALILDRHVPRIDPNIDINNNGLKINGLTITDLTTGNGLTINGYAHRKDTDDKNEQNPSKTVVMTIIRQITALKKSLNAFRQLLSELNVKYNETVEQFPTLHTYS